MDKNTIGFFLFLFLFSPQSSPPKLGDSFGKAAFIALKAIERNASETGGKEVGARIDEADAEAKSPDELRIVKLLRGLSMQRNMHNIEIQTILLTHQKELPFARNEAERKRITDETINDPKMKAIHDRELACWLPLEDALRAREARVPEKCEEEKVDKLVQ